MRRLLLVSALVAVSAAAPGTAEAMTSAERFPAGGSDMARAMRISVNFWGKRACHGNVTLQWGQLSVGMTGQATWMNPFDAWSRPRRNFGCSITFNAAMSFGFKQLCSTMIHEVGHLLGRQHSSNRRSVMYERANGTLRECGGRLRVVESRR